MEVKECEVCFAACQTDLASHDQYLCLYLGDIVDKSSAVRGGDLQKFSYDLQYSKNCKAKFYNSNCFLLLFLPFLLSYMKQNISRSDSQ